MISRCSSPMPWMSVWDVSCSVVTRNVGSSRASRDSEIPSFSSSAFVFGSMATAMTGSGKLIDSSTMRSEEHTSELQSHSDLVCRLLLEKKKKKKKKTKKR